VTETEALAGIAEVAREHLAIAGRIAPEARLVEDLGLDSLRLLTLAAEVENRFRIRLEPEDEAAIETVGDLARTVARKVARARPDAVEPG
jgi:acyl carrier protein